MKIFSFKDLHGYLVENPIQTLIIRRHIVFLVWFIKGAWAACALNGRGCEEIVFEHLEQLASPNLDSDNQESVFDSVETLYNTDESTRWGNIYAVAK